MACQSQNHDDEHEGISRRIPAHRGDYDYNYYVRAGALQRLNGKRSSLVAFLFYRSTGRYHDTVTSAFMFQGTFVERKSFIEFTLCRQMLACSLVELKWDLKVYEGCPFAKRKKGNTAFSLILLTD